jgi:putative peptide zinc metalloprotease protein
MLRPLTGGRALAVLAAGGLLLAAAGDPAAAAAASVGSRVAALPLLVASGLVHELGHAAALLRAGYPPGRIGVGMLAVLPVLWCDVSAVGMLAKRERVRVDLAGPILQLAVAGLCSVVGRLMSGPAAAVCATVAAWAFLATGWSLTPFFRADGFWVLTDLVGLDDLDRPPRRGDPRRTLLLLAAYRLAHAIFFGALAAAALRRADPQTGAGGLALGVGLALAGMVVLRVARFVRPLVRQFP